MITSSAIVVMGERTRSNSPLTVASDGFMRRVSN